MNSKKKHKLRKIGDFTPWCWIPDDSTISTLKLNQGSFCRLTRLPAGDPWTDSIVEVVGHDYVNDEVHKINSLMLGQTDRREMHSKHLLPIEKSYAQKIRREQRAAQSPVSPGRKRGKRRRRKKR